MKLSHLFETKTFALEDLSQRLSLDKLSQHAFDEILEDTENLYMLPVHAGKYLLIHVIQDLFVRSPLNNESWINTNLLNAKLLNGAQIEHRLEHPKISPGFPLLQKLAYDKTAKRLYARVMFEWYDLYDQEVAEARRVYSFEIDPNNSHTLKPNSYGTTDINLTEFVRSLDINKWPNTLMHTHTRI